jgi:hypothetical protein
MQVNFRLQSYECNFCIVSATISWILVKILKFIIKIFKDEISIQGMAINDGAACLYIPFVGLKLTHNESNYVAIL